MPSVPAFSDISKPTNDLIGKDFPLGSTKLDLSTVAPNGLVNYMNNEENYS
jgi:voltage-dependent anion channel protein 2